MKYFITVVEEESISKAAQRLHITQPALSTSIRNAEIEYGQKLLVRGKKGIKLTEAGTFFFDKARNIVQMAEQTNMQMLSFSNAMSGVIHFGTAETDASEIVFAAAKKLMEKYPLIKMHVYQNTSIRIRERVNQGLDDLGLVYSYPDSSVYDSIRISRENSWVLCARKDSFLAQKEEIMPEDLRKEELIVAERTMLDNTLQEWFHCDWKDLNVRTTYSLGPNIGQMVEANLGKALLYNDISYQTPRNSLCTIPLKNSPKENPYIIWKKSSNIPEIILLLLEEIRKIVQEDNKHKKEEK